MKVAELTARATNFTFPDNVQEQEQWLTEQLNKLDREYCGDGKESDR